MKMWRIILAISLALSAHVLQAEPAFVQSGAHDGFTRIVVTVPQNASWNVRKENRSVSLEVERLTDGYDTRRVFDFISKDRVRETKVVENQLVLLLNCDCDVATFLADTRYVVIDVGSPGVALAGTLLPIDDQNGIATTEGRVLAGSEIPSPQERPRLLSDADEPLLGNGPPPSDTVVGSLNKTHQKLANALGSAATRGILVPADRRSSEPPRASRPQIDVSKLDGHLPESAARPAAVTGNIRVTTSFDTLETMPIKGPLGEFNGIPCPADAEIDLAGWGNEKPFNEQMSEARTNLYVEFDRIDPQKQLDLVRTYLHFGFGAEALQALGLGLGLGTSIVFDSQLMFDIATILETGQTSAGVSMDHFLGCESDIQLWAVLATRPGGGSALKDPNPALKALNKLPIHLRNILAPALSRKFLDMGEKASAAAALRSLERLPDRLPTAAKLAQAHVYLGTDQASEGLLQLDDVVDANTAQSPEALIALIDAKLRTEQPISLETALLVEAYAQELRETSIGSDLRRVHVMAMIRSGQFDRAFSEVPDMGAGAETPEALLLRIAMLHELISAADDIVFLEHIFVQQDKDFARLKDTDKRAAASRLLALGFAEKAQQLIESIPVEPLDSKRQTLAARTSLALGQPFRAQADLLGIEGDEAISLRAEAMRALGAFEGASELFGQVGQKEKAAQSAWLSQDWRNLTPLDDGTIGPIAETLAAALGASQDAVGMLTGMKSTLAESGQVRRTLAKLLETAELQDSPPN